VCGRAEGREFGRDPRDVDASAGPGREDGPGSALGTSLGDEDEGLKRVRFGVAETA